MKASLLADLAVIFSFTFLCSNERHADVLKIGGCEPPTASIAIPQSYDHLGSRLDVSNEAHVLIGYPRHGFQTQSVVQGLSFRYGCDVSLGKGECISSTNETYPKLEGTRSTGKSEGNPELVRQSGSEGAQKYPRIRGSVLQLSQSLLGRTTLADGSPPARGHGGRSFSNGTRHGPRKVTLVKYAVFPRHQSTLLRVSWLLVGARWTGAFSSGKKVTVIVVGLFACGVQAIDGPPVNGSSNPKADQGTSNPKGDQLAPLWIAIAIILAYGLHRGIIWYISQDARYRARRVRSGRVLTPRMQKTVRQQRKAFLWGGWSFASTVIGATVFSPAAQAEYYVKWFMGILSILSILKYQEVHYKRQTIMGQGGLWIVPLPLGLVLTFGFVSPILTVLSGVGFLSTALICGLAMIWCAVFFWPYVVEAWPSVVNFIVNNWSFALDIAARIWPNVFGPNTDETARSSRQTEEGLAGGNDVGNALATESMGVGDAPDA